MKYILKKKWHPSQVEEVGHVFEENPQNRIDYIVEPSRYIYTIYPHEIALLCEAGFLEKEKLQGITITETPSDEKADLVNFTLGDKSILKINSRGHVVLQLEQKIDVWTPEQE